MEAAGESQAQSSGKRITPGRAAKRKQPSDSAEKTRRTVKARLSSTASELATSEDMATPLTLEMLRNELATNRQEQMDHIDKRLLVITERMASNTQLIIDERRERQEETKKLNERIDMLMSKPGQNNALNLPLVPRSHHSHAIGRYNNTRADDEYNKYERARNSLVFYPIEGETTEAMMMALQKFITNDMQIPKGEVKRSQIELVRRVRSTRNARARNELLVLFSDTESRDFVLSHAKNLADHKDTAGKPTAGVRIEVPNALLNTKRDFEQYGYALRNELGSDFKRNIRYDDANRTLVMDVKYPGNVKWERITFDQAQRGNRIAKLTPNAISAAPPRLRQQPAPCTPAQRPSASTSSGAASTELPAQQPPTIGEMDEDEVWT